MKISSSGISLAIFIVFVATQSSKIKESANNVYVDKSINAPIKDILLPNRSLHLFSHGKPGKLLLNGEWRDAAAIAAFILKAQLLSSNMQQINIYGCEFAKGDEGKQAVAYLEKRLNISVAASTNITGVDGDWLLEHGNIDASSLSNSIAGNLQCAGILGGVNPTDDFDGDGVCNNIDIDSDNDGVHDAVEAPSCYYTAAEANTIFRISSMFTSPDDDQLDGNIQLLHDISLAQTFNFNTFAVALNPAGSNLFTLEYSTPIDLATITVSNTISSTSGATAVIKGSNNGVTWSAALSPATPITSMVINFTITNNTRYRYYRIETATPGALSAITIGEILSTLDSYISSANPKSTCALDTDGDTKINVFDLDSDGDGCSDAREAGATTSIAPEFVFTGAVGANGLADVLETMVDNAIINYESTYVPNALVLSINACTDTDLDGVFDLVDIDDDNDGTIDEVEAPDCYYIAGEANIISKITSQFTSLDDNQADGDIQLLHDGSPTLTFNFEAFATIQNPTGSNLFTIEYPVPVDLATLRVSQSISNTAGANAVIKGSNDAKTWSAALSPATLITTTPTNFTVTTTTKYRYYRIETGSVAGVLATANTIGEITSAIENHIPSANPKSTCTTDTDGDGIINTLDLNSDNDADECSDAKEAGATASLTPNFVFTGAVGTNGLVNALETIADNSIINYESTYALYATNRSVSACADSDGDGTLDIGDIDDDNDGVLDTEETDFNPYLNTTCEHNLIGRIGFTPTITFTNQLASFIGLIIGSSSTFTTGFAFGNICGEISSGTNAGEFSAPIYYRFVDPNNTSLPVPLKYITLTSDCAGANEILAYDAFDKLGNLLYTQSLTMPSYGASHCLSIQPPANLDVYSIRVTQAASSMLVTGIALKNVLNFKDIDTDGDTVPNRLDLDSDGDNCPDAVESGASDYALANAGVTSPSSATYKPGILQAIPNAIVGTKAAAEYGANGLYAVVENSDATTTTVKYSSIYNRYAKAKNISYLCGNVDGDGLADYFDIDDDNDAVLDAVESPDCFYTPAEWNTLDKFVNARITSDITPIAGRENFDRLTDKDDLLTAVQFGTINVGGQPQNDRNLFLVEFAQPIQLDALYINKANSSQISGNNLNFDGSNDGLTWTHLFINPTNPANSTTNVTVNGGVALDNSNKFTVATGAASYKYYRIRGIPGMGAVTGTGKATELYFDVNVSSYSPSQFPKSNCSSASDLDGDTTQNHHDLDTDNDSCSDAFEAGATTSMVTNFQFPATPDANGNGLNDTKETGTTGTINYTPTYNTFALSDQLKACADNDGDGISDLVDIDDDNDGIVDATENPTCYVSAIAANRISKITSQFASVDDNQLDGDIQMLHDGDPTATFNFNALFPASNPTGSNVFTIEYPISVDLATITVSHLFSITSGANAVIKGSHDGISWSPALSPATSVTTTPINFVITAPIKYKFYRVETGSVPAGFSGAQTISEITSTLDRYVPSANPEIANCTISTDSDNIINSKDLDSDGDGCSDAREGGSTTSTTANFVFTGAVGENGLDNSLETEIDNGTINYTSTYNDYALFILLNACLDSDGDGISDLVDIDDDNDGVLDAVEAPSCYISPAEAITILTVTSGLANNDTQVDGDIQSLHDAAATTNTITTGQALAAANIYTIKYRMPVNLTSLSLTNTTASWGASSTARLRGSMDSITWFNLTAPQATTAGTTKTFTVTSFAGEYRFYQVKGVATASSSAFATQEIEAVLNAASYIASSHPKLTCTVDTDSDGILNQLDLDSDGDGCSDANESAVVGTLLSGSLINNSGVSTAQDAIAAGPYAGNGFADALETGVETGLYRSSYTYANATNSAVKNCVIAPITKPDVNKTYVNKSVSGNLKTNDLVQLGTTYGSATTVPGYTNPGPALPSINADGTYTFVSPVRGIFEFFVPVCPAGVSTNCPVEKLTIYVTDKNLQTNLPIAFPDFAVTKQGIPVTLKVLHNDKSGNTNHPLDTSSLTITKQAKNGVATADPLTGDITYTPNMGFVGLDTVTYRICDKVSPTPNCVTTIAIINVLPSSAANSILASDDHNSSNQGQSSNGNVKTNDQDPDGNGKVVTTQTMTLLGIGSIVILASGEYTFTPDPLFTGAVNFPYTICDDVNPPACTNATLYLTVEGLGVTLPVKLIRFNGYSTASGNLIQWEVAEQTNTKNFEIRHSTDGRHFETIYVTAAAGNSTETALYQFLHTVPLESNHFYQLVTVDFDGKKSYSSIVSILLGRENEDFYAFPNPSKGKISLSSLKDVETIQIHSFKGALVWQQNNINANNQVYDISSLKNGSYVLSLIRKNAKPVQIKIQVIK